WYLLLARRKPAVLHESEPVWLPDYALVEGGAKFGGIAGTAALTLALAKELSGETHLERAQMTQTEECQCDHPTAAPKTASELYVETTEQRFNGIRRCC
ncbi:MAG: carbon starvation protein A, partial [Verrucomicrobia bacterium]|nr:carbon starvation protein A [Verrucomicrobiota bacterium]